MLKKILNPFPKKCKVYGVLNTVENISNSKRMYKFDIVNESMISFDLETLSLQNDGICDIANRFYLYFMEFIAFSHNSIVILESNINDGDYFEFTLVREDNEIDIEVDYCDVYFASSPLTRKKYRVQSIEKRIEFSKLYPIANYKGRLYDNEFSISSTINSALGHNNSVSKFIVHSIGEGNCNSIVFENHKRLFFDLGISRYVKLDPHYKSYINVFKRLNISKYYGAIVSHWDWDHYIGVAQLTTKLIFNRKLWIVPEPGSNPNALRITSAVSKLGILVAINNKFIGKMYEGSGCTLYKGSGKNKNDSGIHLLVNKEKKLISMADVSYESAAELGIRIKTQFNNQIDYIIIPHHGADYNNTMFCSAKNNVRTAEYSSEISEAIISTGYNPVTYKHPRLETVKEICDNGFRLKKTNLDGTQVFIFK